MYKLKTGFCVALCLLALTGCSAGAAPVESTFTIEKKGNLVSTVVEEFAQAYYDKEELEQYALRKVAEYNGKSAGDPISILKIETKDESVQVVMEYAGAADYEAFNGVSLFVGTVQEAYEAGYDLDVTLKNASEPEKTVGKSDILGMGDKSIVIAEENICYSLPSKALYISENADVFKKTVVKKTDAGIKGNLYIIY